MMIIMRAWPYLDLMLVAMLMKVVPESYQILTRLAAACNDDIQTDRIYVFHAR